MISIIIPLYNKENQITHTLQSVLNQTFQNFEVVIVNDGSTDCSVAKVEKVGDSRIRLVHQKNGGVSTARNKGIEEAKYELLAFLDADDEWKPEYLETQYNLFKKYPMCSVYACNYEFRNIEGKTLSTVVRKLPLVEKDGILSNYFEVASCSNPPICSISIMTKKEAILSIGGFPTGVKSGEDLLTWARLATKYKIAYSFESLAIYQLGYSNPRPPEEQDYVGEQLEKLSLTYKKTLMLKRYVAFWYKMRMCRCLIHRMYDKAFKAFIKSIIYNPFQVKIYLSIFYYSFK